jgi:hypothetical protein
VGHPEVHVSNTTTCPGHAHCLHVATRSFSNATPSALFQPRTSFVFNLHQREVSKYSLNTRSLLSFANLALLDQNVYHHHTNRLPCSCSATTPACTGSTRCCSSSTSWKQYEWRGHPTGWVRCKGSASKEDGQERVRLCQQMVLLLLTHLITVTRTLCLPPTT